MTETSGICAIVPIGQHGFRPIVHGMGIVVTPRIIITCAHVVDAVLGPRWWVSESQPVVRASFPFAGGACLDGVVSRDLWFPANRGDPSGVSDIAVIGLLEDVPAAVGTATLAKPTPGLEVKAYGFRGEPLNGGWVSHPDGQWAAGAIIGPQPEGRGQIDGLRTTGARVERGFSGSGVYAPTLKAVVGMIVESDRDVVARVAQFIDASALEAILGGLDNLNSFARVQTTRSRLSSALARKRAHHSDHADAVKFVGRKDAQRIFRQRLTGGMLPMHIVGHGGIGKSSLLKRFASLAEAEGFDTAYVDLGFVQGRLDLIRKVVFALLMNGSVDFPEYLACVDRYATIEERLLRQPDLEPRVIYYQSMLRELLPTLDSDVDRHGTSRTPDAEPFSSGEAIAVVAALRADEREFFIDPLRVMLDAFAADMAGSQLVLELDRTERLPRQVGEWIVREFVPVLDRTMVITAGRDDISGPWGWASGSIRVVELEPLSGEESLELLAGAGISEALRARVAEISCGVPLALALAAEMAGNLDDQALDMGVDSYVVDRMISVFLDGIPADRRKALQRLSVFRRFNRETILDLEICDHRTIDEMLNVRFIKHVPQGYAVHDRVRDFILRDMRRHEPRVYQHLHDEAAQYYETLVGSYTEGKPDFLELLYHRLSAQPETEFEQLRQHFTSAALAIKPDFSEAIVSVARESDVDGSLPLLWLRFFEGSVMRQRFDFSGANEVYEEILQDPSIEHQGELKGELLYQQSVALWYLCRFEDARAVAQASVELNGALGKERFENRSLGIIGLSLDRMGKFESAIRVVRRMAKKAERGDPHSLGYALNSIGYFSWHSGNWRRSETALRQCLDLWRSVENPVGECYPLGHLGLLYCATGRRDLAAKMLDAGKRLTEICGNLEMRAKILQNMSRYQVLFGDPVLAVQLASESLDVCNRLKHPYYAADSLRLLSEAHIATGDFAAAKQAVTAAIDRLPGSTATYLQLRLRIASADVDVHRTVAEERRSDSDLKEQLAGLASTARTAGFKNLAAEAELGRLRLLALGDSSRVYEVFESGANIAFSYNWYAGISFLERAREVLLGRESLRPTNELANASFGEARLRELYRAAGSSTLKTAVEIDQNRLAAFVGGGRG